MLLRTLSDYCLGLTRLKAEAEMADFLNAFEAFLSGETTDKDPTSMESEIPAFKSPPDKSEDSESKNKDEIESKVPLAELSVVPSVPVKPIVPPIKLRTPPPPPPPIQIIPIKPVKGKVYPPTYPPADRPGRNTNQLLFIKRNIMGPLWNHRFAWPFKKPVDAEKLKLPDYHTIIKQPMDFGTIKKRLMNKYYWCADECRKDIDLVFFNCFLYNKPDQDIVFMGKTLQKVYLNKIEDMTSVEKVVDIKPVKRKPQLYTNLKRSLNGDSGSEQEHHGAEKKLKNFTDFESEIPVSRIAWVKPVKRRLEAYSESESGSESESEESDGESQIRIPLERKEGVGSAGDRLEKFGRPAVGAGGGGGAGAGGSDEVVTPLSERKPIKHHCKYCAQPFISRYVRDMHEKQKHVLNNYPAQSAEKKVPLIKSPSSSGDGSSGENRIMSAVPPGGHGGLDQQVGGVHDGSINKPGFPVLQPGRGGRGGRGGQGGRGGHNLGKSGVQGRKVDQPGLQIIPMNQESGKLEYQSPNVQMQFGYDHVNFVDKKHQAVHKQAQRNQAKNSQYARQKPVNKSTNIQTNKITSNQSNGNGGKEAGRIPEDMLFPMTDEFSLRRGESDTFSNNSPAAKLSPDSGYISSRGVGMDSSPSFSLPESYNGEKSPGMSTISMLQTSSSDLCMTSISPSITSTITSRSSLNLTQSSRETEDDRMTDLQKELGFVEPTFPRSMVGVSGDSVTGVAKDGLEPGIRLNQGLRIEGQHNPLGRVGGLGLPGPVIPRLGPGRPSNQLEDFVSSPSSYNTYSRSTLGVKSVTNAPVSHAGFPPRLNPPPLPMIGQGGVLAGRVPAPISRPPTTIQYTGRVSVPSSFPPNLDVSVLSPSQGIESRPISLISRVPSKSPKPSFAVPEVSGSLRIPPSQGSSSFTSSRIPTSSFGLTSALSSHNSIVKPISSLGMGSTGSSRPENSLQTGGFSNENRPKMDVLAQTLKLSDLDFDEFEPEPTLIPGNQTQELKLEDLKHLQSEPPVPLTVRNSVKGGGEELRDLLEFSTFSYQDVNQIIGSGGAGGGVDNLVLYPSHEAVYTQVVAAGGNFTKPLDSMVTVSRASAPSFSFSSEFSEPESGFSVPPGMDFSELQTFSSGKSAPGKQWWP